MYIYIYIYSYIYTYIYSIYISYAILTVIISHLRNFMMQAYPAELLPHSPAPLAAASSAATAAAQRWCGLAAVQEDDGEAILPLYDAMAEKMETWWDFEWVFLNGKICAISMGHNYYSDL